MAEIASSPSLSALIDQRTGLGTKAGIGGVEPDDRLGVDQDQPCISQSIS